MDRSPAAIARARSVVPEAVETAVVDVPSQWPGSTFDLVVLSEVGYYYGAQDLEVALSRAVGSLTQDGVLVACHWRHPVPEYPLGGDDVHAAAEQMAAYHEELQAYIEEAGHEAPVEALRGLLQLQNGLLLRMHERKQAIAEALRRARRAEAASRAYARDAL